MVEAKIKPHLICGGNPFKRRRIINNVKKEIFKSQGIVLRAITLYGADINLQSFKDLIFTFSFQKKKIILIKDFTSLVKPIRKFIIDNFTKILKNNYLIFDSDLPYLKLQKNKKMLTDDFFNYLFEEGAVHQFRPEPLEVNFDDFRKKLYKSDLDSCLFILEELLSKKGNNKLLATQILGLITSKFSYLHESQKRKEAFNQLWQADRALKQSNIDVRLLLERLLIKLFA